MVTQLNLQLILILFSYAALLPLHSPKPVLVPVFPILADGTTDHKVNQKISDLLAWSPYLWTLNSMAFTQFMLLFILSSPILFKKFRPSFSLIWTIAIAHPASTLFLLEAILHPKDRILSVKIKNLHLKPFNVTLLYIYIKSLLKPISVDHF